MKRSPEVISSEPLKVSVPRSWAELSMKQFIDICNLFNSEIFASSFDAILFLKLAKLKFIGRVGQDDIMLEYGSKLYVIGADVLGVAPDHISWVHDVADLFDLKLHVKGIHKSAVDLKLESFSLAQFIAADSFYSGFIATQKPAIADRLVKMLWPGKKNIKGRDRSAAVIWFSALKKYLKSRFPDLYSDPDKSDIFSSVTASPAAVREQVDAMIRALTKGDITLEERVLEAPMYRALTELDLLAKEYKELKKL